MMIYLTELADKLGIDPVEAAKAKLRINEEKYPATLVRGRATKYTEYSWCRRFSFLPLATGPRKRLLYVPMLSTLVHATDPVPKRFAKAARVSSESSIM